jgi:hypothetical protein
MIEYKDGKKYWNGRECDANFIHRTLADMFPHDYERYIQESREFNKTHTVLQCKNCYYEWVHNETSLTHTRCLSCQSTELHKL